MGMRACVRVVGREGVIIAGRGIHIYVKGRVKGGLVLTLRDHC